MLKKVHFKNFRNLVDNVVELSPNINVFVANNGHGKTNLIEAIYYLFHNKSFKTKQINEVTSFENKYFTLSSLVGVNKVQIHKTSNNNKITINQQIVKRSADLIHLHPVQLISPDKGFIVGGSPKQKRYYLDWGVFHTKHAFAKTLKNHQKILKSINLILVKNQPTAELDAYFFLLSKQVADINTNKKDYTNSLKKILKNNYFKNFKKKYPFIVDFDFELNYGFPNQIDVFDQNSIYQFLVNNQENIIKKKYLNYGAHRSDVIFSLRQRTDKFLSRGEQKTLSLVFWLLQVLFLVENKTPPLLLIDDIGSELDQQKFQLVLELLLDLNIQTIITSISTPNQDLFKTNKPVKFFNIDQGEITTV